MILDGWPDWQEGLLVVQVLMDSGLVLVGLVLTHLWLWFRFHSPLFTVSFETLVLLTF